MTILKFIVHYHINGLNVDLARIDLYFVDQYVGEFSFGHFTFSFFIKQTECIYCIEVFAVADETLPEQF